MTVQMLIALKVYTMSGYIVKDKFLAHLVYANPVYSN